MYSKEELCRLEQSELVKLIDEGQLVYLPCKVGDVVYIPSEKFPCEIERVITTDGYIYFEWASVERSLEITECWNEGAFKLSEIGKTVFFTAEEAEKALKERDT